MQSWVTTFIQKARAENAVLQNNGAKEVAQAREQLLVELAEAAPNEDALLGLAAAAREAGYSTRSL